MHPGLFDQANEAIRFAGMSLGLPRYVSGGVGRHNVRKMDLRGVYRQLDKYVLQLVASGPHPLFVENSLKIGKITSAWTALPGTLE